MLSTFVIRNDPKCLDRRLLYPFGGSVQNSQLSVHPWLDGTAPAHRRTREHTSRMFAGGTEQDRTTTEFPGFMAKLSGLPKLDSRSMLVLSTKEG